MIFNEFFENKTPPFIDYLFIEEVKLLGIEMLVKNNLDAGVHDAIAEMAWTMLVHINPKVNIDFTTFIFKKFRFHAVPFSGKNDGQFDFEIFSHCSRRFG